MKKCLIIIFVIIFCLSLFAGCGGKEDDSEKSTATDEQSERMTDNERLMKFLQEHSDELYNNPAPNDAESADKNAEGTGTDENAETATVQVFGVESVAPADEQPEESEAESYPVASVATEESPAPLQNTYTWSGSIDSEDLGTYGFTYSFTVKNVKPITVEEIEALNVKVNQDDPTKQLEYRMLTVVVSADVTMTKETDSKHYLSSYYPKPVDSQTTNDASVIGCLDYGFDGCLIDSIEKATNSGTLEIDKPASYTAEGKVIVPVIKGEKSFLGVNDDAGNEYYFWLE